MANKFKIVVCGGTFDHFHKGHKSFLKYVFSVGKRVIVGVTSDQYVRSDKRQAISDKQIEPFKKRKEGVFEFVETEGVLDRVEIVKIDDLFGPTLSKDLQIDAIVISQDTKKGAEIINRKRKELGLKELKILIAPIDRAQDGKIISSARIRNGEINREGRLYVSPLWLKTDLILPENLRKELKKPFGALFRHSGQARMTSSYVITVGDVTTKLFNKLALNQHIAVIDFKVARQKKYSSILELGFSGREKIIIINNPAGHITFDLFCAIAKIFESSLDQKRIILKVMGEEDLAVLPLILFSPLGAIIYYGQPGEGIVKIEVLEEIKEIAYSLVNRFEKY